MYNVIRRHFPTGVAMALLYSLAACTSGDNSHEPPQFDVEQGSSIPAVLPDPVATDIAQNPVLSDLTEDPDITAITEVPGLREVTDDPVEPEVEESPLLPEVTDEPAVPEIVESPPRAEETDEPTVPEVEESPVLPDITEDSTVPNIEESPVLPEVTEDPVLPEVTEDPAVPEITEDPAVPEITEDPAVPEIIEDPAVPETTEDPAVPENTEDPAVPETTEDPAVPETTEDIAVPENTEDPAVPETTEDSTVPETTEDLAAPELAEDPVTNEVTSEVDEYTGYSTPDGVVQCSSEDIKRRVDFDMRDYYIYHDQVPLLNTSEFDTPENLIKALRVDPDLYSNVQDTITQVSFTEEGINTGHGLWFQPAADGVVRFRESRLGSPSDRAGIRRGDEILSINGRPIRNVTNNEIREALAKENSPVEMSIRTGDEAPRTVSVAYEQYRWKTAGHLKRFFSSANTDSLVVGYLHIQRFLVTTHNEINEAFDELATNGGIDELIVDLRYNPGGRMWVARHMASAIAGEAVFGNVFVKHQWNKKYANNNIEEFFDTIP